MDGAHGKKAAKRRPWKRRLAALLGQGLDKGLDKSADGGPGRPISAWKLRFLAWWEGYDLAQPQAPLAHSAKKKRRREDIVPELRESRLAPRIECKNLVWGEGFTSPGDAAYCCDLVRPAGLTAEHSMLDLGAGLGGPARAFAREFGVWVTGKEIDRELADAGMELSVAAGMARKAPISVFNPKTTEIPDRKFDCIFSKETIFLVADKREFIRKIERGLKSRGNLMFTDFIAADGASGKPNLRQWINSEPGDPHPISAKETTGILAESGLEPRVARDITDEFESMLIATWNNWKDIVETLNTYVNRDELMQELAKETQLWTVRQQAIQSGDLKVYSFYATKRAAGMGMSDW